MFCHPKSQRPTPVKIIVAIVVAIIAVGVLSVLVTFLWNRVMVDIFSLPEITYRQALALFILARVLFGVRPFQKHPVYSPLPSHAHFFTDKLDGKEEELYEEYWKEEGRKSFEDYIERKENQSE